MDSTIITLGTAALGVVGTAVTKLWNEVSATKKRTETELEECRDDREKLHSIVTTHAVAIARLEERAGIAALTSKADE